MSETGARGSSVSGSGCGSVGSEVTGATGPLVPGASSRSVRSVDTVSVARREIVIRFFGCPNPKNYRVSDLPAPFVGKSRFFTGAQIPEFIPPGV